MVLPPVGYPDMRCLPDQVHCSRCRHFYGHLPGGISCSRNQGTPQSAYRSTPQVGMCGTNNPGLPKSWQIIQRRFWLWPCTLSIRTLVDNRDRLGFAPERCRFAPGSNRIAPESCQPVAWRRGRLPMLPTALWQEGEHKTPDATCCARCLLCTIVRMRRGIAPQPSLPALAARGDRASSRMAFAECRQAV